MKPTACFAQEFAVQILKAAHEQFVSVRFVHSIDSSLPIGAGVCSRCARVVSGGAAAHRSAAVNGILANREFDERSLQTEWAWCSFEFPGIQHSLMDAAPQAARVETSLQDSRKFMGAEFLGLRVYASP
jgi:hypothetical protein